MSDRIVTANLEAALLKAYPLPEYATFFEVGDATGGRHSRWADAVSMAIWPSRGLAITGFELKASRGDWLREKKKPEKSCAIQKYCNRWVLLTAPNVILPGELPETWGHVELVGNKLMWRVQPPKLEPVPLDPPFVASLLRRCGQVSEGLIAARIEAVTAEARANQNARIARAVEDATRRHSETAAAIAKFKEITGVDLNTWSAEDVAADFAAYRAARSSLQWTKYTHTAKQLRESADKLDAAMTALHECGLTEDSKA
jgi:hypothetical protein